MSEWTSADHYIPRDDVPGHAMRTRSEGHLFVVTCECGWESKALHLSAVIGAENRHRIEVGS